MNYLIDHYGDIASVLGLALSLAGFSLTIQSVRGARKAAEDARRAASEAVKRVGSQLFETDISTSRRLIGDIRSACRAGQWARAIDKIEEAMTRLSRVSGHHLLTDEERTRVLASLNDLSLIGRFLEREGLTGAFGDLTDPRKKRLDDLGTLLSAIEGRLQRAVLELNHGER